MADPPLLCKEGFHHLINNNPGREDLYEIYNPPSNFLAITTSTATISKYMQYNCFLVLENPVKPTIEVSQGGGSFEDFVKYSEMKIKYLELKESLA